MEGQLSNDGHTVRTWRQEDLEQRNLDNALVLWRRFVQENRRGLDEAAEQLRGLANLAALVSGFDMVAFVQFGFDPTIVPKPVLVGFAITNSLTVGLNTCCMAMCGLMLASTFKMYASLASEQEQAEFLQHCRAFACRYRPGMRPPAVRRTFRKCWDFSVKPEWHRAMFIFSIGIGMFLANIAFAGFIKFGAYVLPAALLAVPLGAGLVYYYAAHARWLRHLLGGDEAAAELLDPRGVLAPAGLPFDWHLPPLERPVSVAAGPPPAPPPLLRASDLALTPPHWPSSDLPSREEEVRWRGEDYAQATLANARALWFSFVAKNRNDVEERAEQLRSMSFLAGIVASFAVASLLQLVFDDTQIAHVWQLGYAVCVGLTAGMGTISMTMCSLILMSILKTGPTLVSEAEQAHFLAQCREFAQGYRPGDRPPAPRRTFRYHWDQQCQGEFLRAFTAFSISLAFLLLQLIFAAFIKYPGILEASVSSAAISGASLVFLFGANVRWVAYIARSSPTPQEARPIMAVQAAGLPFDWHLPSRPRLPSFAQQPSLMRRTLTLLSGRRSTPSSASPGKRMWGTP